MQYRIVSSADIINSEEVLRLLKMTYWANNRTIEQIYQWNGNSDRDSKIYYFVKLWFFEPIFNFYIRTNKIAELRH